MNSLNILRMILWKLCKQILMCTKPWTASEKHALIEAFKKMILQHLPGQGWQFNKSQFTNLVGAADRIFFTGISDQKLQLSLKIAMGIRFSDIEELWRQSQGMEQSLGHWTVEGGILNYAPSADLHYKIEHETDVKAIEARIHYIIENACLPFWQEFGTITQVDRMWNCRAFDFECDGTNALHHATRSMIIAHLAKNPNFETLVTMRRSEICGKLHPSLQANGLSQYDKLISWLRKSD